LLIAPAADGWLMVVDHVEHLSEAIPDRDGLLAELGHSSGRIAVDIVVADSDELILSLTDERGAQFQLEIGHGGLKGGALEPWQCVLVPGLSTEDDEVPVVVLVDGPRWKSAAPPTTRNVSAVGCHCIIWSPEDLRTLPARFIPSCNDWYCSGENATIQFIRCVITGTVITEGRFAIATDQANGQTAAKVERRYNLLRRWIKKTCINSVVRWRNPNFPEAPAGPNRSANPSNPDGSLWVGPSAVNWLIADATRRIKIWPKAPVEGAISQR
jgi:hypothetical protein